MSAYEQDQLVTKTSVILSKPDDWEKWFFVRKNTANRDGMWPYVNPGLSGEEFKQLQHEKPQERPIWRFKNKKLSEKQDVDIEDLSAEEVSVHSMWARKFEREEARWLQKEKALKEFKAEIARTIDVKHLDLIVNCTDLYSRLTTLKKHLCPSVSERNHQLRNLDAWFDEWVTIIRLLTEARMPEIDGNRSQEDFIISVRGLDDS
ncbi:hypothetical protein BU25DRAFT_434539 [Macroventuria anomochaeta]|uniref:Uncharacterized protein n=1 Tax=Macroventuria anomochaeta TaxID=301207 RepID=A0ACB6RM26_9PLEO|nr:uncharacterized protein BU25DRAFT_434539 [Macroventuria anomochaeta]KAF2622834.1 hypothetical protein BU25DRAFT_434539 [Macroventuria anomochaeta]